MCEIQKLFLLTVHCTIPFFPIFGLISLICINSIPLHVCRIKDGTFKSVGCYGIPEEREAMTVRSETEIMFCHLVFDKGKKFLLGKIVEAVKHLMCYMKAKI